MTEESGQIWDTPNDVGNAFVEYFFTLFTGGSVGDVNPCIQPIERRVTEAMNVDLIRSFAMEEIEIALFQLGPLTAPGPDGLNACFYQTNWLTMREEVCHVILDILNVGVMPKDLNMTYVTLIPKLKKSYESYEI